MRRIYFLLTHDPNKGLGCSSWNILNPYVFVRSTLKLELFFFFLITLDLGPVSGKIVPG